MPVQVDPYSKIAPLYDTIMTHVNYKLWAKHIGLIMAMYQMKPRRMIDLSCGTGSLLSHLVAPKRKIFGSDRSLGMIKQAGFKLTKNFAALCCCDFLKISVKARSVDVALVLYDSINYIIEEEQVGLFFREVYDLLDDGGLFIFDVVLPYICRKAFANYSETNVSNGNGYERKAWYNDPDSMQFNEFRIFDQGNEYCELHTQKIRSIEEWRDLLKDSPFENVSIFSNFSMSKVHKKSERAHFVCQKDETL